MQKHTKNKIWLTVILVGTLIIGNILVFSVRHYFEYVYFKEHPPKPQHIDPNSVINLG